MPVDKYCQFQELKSLAQASGLITLAEAQTVYHYLGITTDVFDHQSAAVKIVLTSFFGKLLTMKRMGKL